MLDGRFLTVGSLVLHRRHLSMKEYFKNLHVINKIIPKFNCTIEVIMLIDNALQNTIVVFLNDRTFNSATENKRILTFKLIKVFKGSY